MTTIMQRPQSPRSTQQHLSLQLSSDDHSYDYNHDLQPRSQHYMSTRDQLQHHSSSPDLASLGVSSTNDLGEQLASLQRELLGDNLATSASNHSSTSHYDPRSSNGEDNFHNDYYAIEEKVGESSRSSDDVNNSFGNADVTTSVGLFEDPEVLALIEQSSHLDAEHQANLASHQVHSSFHSADGFLPQQSHLDSSSTSAFEFPDLPASLLDQAPEYEYVSC